MDDRPAKGGAGTTHGGRVFARLSAQGYNTEDDIARLVDAPAMR